MKKTKKTQTDEETKRPRAFPALGSLIGRGRPADFSPNAPDASRELPASEPACEHACGLAREIAVFGSDEIPARAVFPGMTLSHGEDPAPTAGEFVAYLREELERRKRERAPYELSWRLNADFLSGNQNRAVDAGRGALADEAAEYRWKEQGVYNRIAPIYDTRLAHLRSVNYDMTVRPATGNPDDRDKAEISTALLRATQRQIGFESLKNRLIAWAELCGTAFCLSYWDGRGGRRLGQLPAAAEAESDPTEAAESGAANQVFASGRSPAADQFTAETKPEAANQVFASGRSPAAAAEEIYEGDLRCGVLSPYEVFPESCEREEVTEQRSLITDQILPVGEIYDLYGIRVPGRVCQTFALTPALPARNGSCPTAASVEAVGAPGCEHVLTYYEAPSRTFPEGRLAVVVGEELLHYGSLPCGVIPVVAVKCKAVPGQFFGKSFIQELIPLQRAYNACKNCLHDVIKATAASPLLIPEGSVDDLDELLDAGLAPNSVLSYRQDFGKPEHLSGGQVPTGLVAEMNQLAADMEYTAGISQLMTYGAAPSGLTSGTAIEQLRQIDGTRLSLTSGNMRQAVLRLAALWLTLYKAFATGCRVLRTVGEEGVPAALTWCAEDINSFDVVYDAEDSMSFSEERQRENFLEAYRLGLFGDESGEVPREAKEKLIGILKLGPAAGELTLADLQRKNAKQENALFEEGILPEIDKYDDHALHIEEHTRHALSFRFRQMRKKNPALAEAFDSHIIAHASSLKAHAPKGEEPHE